LAPCSFLAGIGLVQAATNGDNDPAVFGAGAALSFLVALALFAAAAVSISRSRSHKG